MKKKLIKPLLTVGSSVLIAPLVLSIATSDKDVNKKYSLLNKEDLAKSLKSNNQDVFRTLKSNSLKSNDLYSYSANLDDWDLDSLFNVLDSKETLQDKKDKLLKDAMASIKTIEDVYDEIKVLSDEIKKDIGNNPRKIQQLNGMMKKVDEYYKPFQTRKSVWISLVNISTNETDFEKAKIFINSEVTNIKLDFKDRIEKNWKILQAIYKKIHRSEINSIMSDIQRQADRLIKRINDTSSRWGTLLKDRAKFKKIISNLAGIKERVSQNLTDSEKFILIKHLRLIQQKILAEKTLVDFELNNLKSLLDTIQKENWILFLKAVNSKKVIHSKLDSDVITKKINNSLTGLKNELNIDLTNIPKTSTFKIKVTDDKTGMIYLDIHMVTPGATNPENKSFSTCKIQIQHVNRRIQLQTILEKNTEKIRAIFAKYKNKDIDFKHFYKGEKFKQKWNGSMIANQIKDFNSLLDETKIDFRGLPGDSKYVVSASFLKGGIIEISVKVTVDGLAQTNTVMHRFNYKTNSEILKLNKAIKKDLLNDVISNKEVKLKYKNLTPTDIVNMFKKDPKTQFKKIFGIDVQRLSDDKTFEWIINTNNTGLMQVGLRVKFSDGEVYQTSRAFHAKHEKAKYKNRRTAVGPGGWVLRTRTKYYNPNIHLGWKSMFKK